MTYKTTAADFRLFVATCKACIKKWGISGFRIDYVHEPLKEARAECRASWYTSVAALALSTEWNSKPTRELIILSARHEVVHLILDEMNSVAIERYTSDNARKQALERAVNHLESLLP